MYQSSNKSPILRILRTLQRTNNKRRLFLSDEAKQLRREQLEKDMAKRDEYDPEKKKERERAEKKQSSKPNIG